MTRTDPKGIPAPDGFVIVFIIMAITAGCTVGASAWQARYPPPAALAKAEPIPEGKRADRIEPTPIKPRPVPTESIKPKVATLSELVRSPWPCAAIRKATEQYGRDAVRGYAKAKGYTKKQIDEAMACVVEKRT